MAFLVKIFGVNAKLTSTASLIANSKELIIAENDPAMPEIPRTAQATKVKQK